MLTDHFVVIILHRFYLGDGINQWPLITTGKARLIRKQFIYNIDEFGSAIRYVAYMQISIIIDNLDTISTS